MAILVFVATALLWWPSCDNGFVSLDDPTYVTENLHVLRGLSWENLRWSLTAIDAGMWHPLTWISYLTDIQLFGPDAAKIHGVNVLLHAFNAMLLFLWLWTSTRRRWSSLLVAAIFALHPLRAESVVWISERKDVLSGMFWMLTLLAWIRYSQRPGPGRYVLVFASMAIGLLAKPMLVTLPIVLLLLDFWPLKRGCLPGVPLAEGGAPVPTSRLILEKIPLLGLSAATAVISVLSQKGVGAMHTVDSVSLPMRAAQAISSYAAYIGKSLVPTNLAVFYTHPTVYLSPGEIWMRAAGALVVLVLLTLLAFRLRQRYPAALIGWLWYLITLLPVIGLIQVGNQALADRYTYLPGVGLALAIIFPLASWSQSAPARRRAGIAIAAALLAFLSTLTVRQIGVWKDSRNLFEHALRVTPSNYTAHGSLGILDWQDGNRVSARRHFQQALSIHPSNAVSHTNLGLLLKEDGDVQGAEQHLRRALELQPGAHQPWTGLGDLFRSQNRLEEAEHAYRQALRLSPTYIPANMNLGLGLFRQGRIQEARAQFQQVLRLDPTNVDAHYNLGAVGLELEDPRAALHHYSEVLRLEPGRSRARFHRAGILLETGEFRAALEDMRIVARQAPAVADVHVRLGRAQAAMGDRTGAEASFRKALELQPGHPLASMQLEEIQTGP